MAQTFVRGFLQRAPAVKLASRLGSLRASSTVATKLGALSEKEKKHVFLQAAATGNTDLVSELLQTFPPTVADVNGRTPLHLAASEGHLNVLKLLLPKAHGNINPLDKTNSTPLSNALSASQQEVVSFLRSQGAVASAHDEEGMRLIQAASSGDAAAVKHLLERGVSPAVADYDSRTPLHLAASEGNHEIFHMLLEAGANINAVDRWGFTPLQDAIRNGKAQLLTEATGVKQLSRKDFSGLMSQDKLARITIKQMLLTSIGDFPYATAWLTKEAGAVSLSDAFVIHAANKTQILSVREHQVKTAQPDERVVQAAKSGEIHWTTSNVPGFKSSLCIPLKIEGQTAMVLQYLSEKPMSEMTINAEEMQLAAQHVLNSYALVHDTSGVFLNQMIAVYNNIAKTQFFTEHTVRKEVDSFYSQLNLDPYYFHIHEPSDVSTHLLAYLTAKLHAESVGDSSACEYLSELPNSATYISGGSERIARKFQQRMSEKYFGDAEFSGINEEPTDRKSVIGDDAPTLRSFYSPRINFSLVSRSPFVNPNPAPGETDIWQLATVKFLEDRSIPTLKKFENLLSQASGQLMPVIDTYNRPEAGIVTMVVKAGSTDGLLRDASVIFDSCGQKAEKVYMDYFSNGYVIFNWHLSRPLEDSVASEIRDHLNWSWLLPKNTISDLMTSGQLSAPELGYTYSAWKYAYHFLMRQNDELLGLSSTVSHDPTALRQLQRLAKKVRMEVATEARCADSIRANVPLVKDLYRDFIARHKPGASSVEDIATKIENAPIEDETDREVLRAFLAFNENVLKTNFFKPNKAAVSYRLNPKILSGAFPEIPFGVFLVLGSEFRGFHVRFDDVARGGIRLIKARDRHQWERNAATVFDENYNLAWTQQNKNKDIPEGGSKGTIMLNLNKQKDGAVAFNKYIDAMLDLLLPGKDIVDHYKTPEILFFGPDEGTADFMDWAAIYARRRGYDYWRAITTGKSPKLGGIPHDVFGMTTLSVHECVLGILRKAGVVEEQTTKLQTGGPDGDLGSNELQISKDITKAVVDGSGVLFDPKGLDREELIRLAKSRKMIREFNPKKLSSDGFIVLVDQKDVTLPDGTVVESGTDFRNSFHLDPRAAADLFVPCGGRPESINATTVKKITPDGKPNFKYIVEGANLFLTQEARLYLENLGVVIVKDAAANKGGVTSSSNEVLAALAMNEEEHKQHMCVSESGVVPAFYTRYAREVQERIKENARLEFECLWTESKRTGTPMAITSDLISERINTLNNNLKPSDLWEDKKLVRQVLSEVLPKSLQELLGLDVIISRLPKAYINATLSAYFASRYVYAEGLEPDVFAFYNFMSAQKSQANSK